MMYPQTVLMNPKFRKNGNIQKIRRIQKKEKFVELNAHIRIRNDLSNIKAKKKSNAKAPIFPSSKTKKRNHIQRSQYCPHWVPKQINPKVPKRTNRQRSHHQKQKRNSIQTTVATAAVATKVVHRQNQTQNQKHTLPLGLDQGHAHVQDQGIAEITEKIIEITTVDHAVDHAQIHPLTHDHAVDQSHNLVPDHGHDQDQEVYHLRNLRDQVQVAHHHIHENVNGNVIENEIEGDAEEITENQVILDRVVEVIRDQRVQAIAG